VAGKRQLAPAAEREPVERGDHRFWEPVDAVEKFNGVRTLGKVRDISNVHARAEPLFSGAGKDDNTDLFVFFQRVESAVQVFTHCQVDRVHRRSVERDDRYKVLYFNKQGCVRHD